MQAIINASSGACMMWWCMHGPSLNGAIVQELLTTSVLACMNLAFWGHFV